MSEPGTDLGDILKKIGERLLPTLAYVAHGPKAGIAAGALVFAAWLARNRPRPMGFQDIGSLLESEERLLAELGVSASRARARESELMSVLQEAKVDIEKRRIERALAIAREERERIEEELELAELRILALKRIASLGDARLKRDVALLLSRIRQGNWQPDGDELALLRGLEESWRKRHMAMSTLRRLLE